MESFEPLAGVIGVRVGIFIAARKLSLRRGISSRVLGQTPEVGGRRQMVNPDQGMTPPAAVFLYMKRTFPCIHALAADAAEGTGMARHDKSLPLVYSCSGCSSAAQAANYIALALDHRGKAEMSCIAGVGGDVPSLVKLAKSGRPVVALDGCALNCVKNCLARHGVEPAVHHVLSDYGVKKRYHEMFDKAQVEELVERIVAELPRQSAEEPVVTPLRPAALHPRKRAPVGEDAADLA
jgi:uncharacterized metal-binding protein